MKLGKIFICINILVLSLLMLTGCTEKWPRILVTDLTSILDGDIIETENYFPFYCRVKLKGKITHQVDSIFEFNPATECNLCHWRKIY